MSEFYAAEHRSLQDRFDSRRMADLMVAGLVHDALTEPEAGFIGSLDMFFLSTVNASGQPPVSYKGGAPGFVKVPDPGTLVFPCYDGNGMFYSAGNIAGQAEVGLLFISFQVPHRLRVQGRAEIVLDDPLMADYPGALLLVRVAIREIFVNCPRYIHGYQQTGRSKYVPADGVEPPIPAWKRIDFVQDALPACDQGKAAAAGGLISMEDYGAKVLAGDA